MHLTEPLKDTQSTFQTLFFEVKFWDDNQAQTKEI